MIRHLYRDIDGTLTDVSAYVRRLEWQSVEKAEEGSVGSWQVLVDDVDGTLDFRGHRQWFIEETTSETTDDLVFAGFVAEQEITAWPGMPLGRVWQLTLTDGNTFWQRTIMRGTDCNRPAETDTARMAWLLNTSEAALINDKVSFVASTGGVAMDAHDYRGEYVGQIVSDCAMQSGRNWYLFFQKQTDGTRDLIAWYKRDTATDYVSPLYITNDLADIRADEATVGGGIVFAMSADTRLTRDPSRVYCGCYMAYEAGATYRHNAATHAAFAHRDISATQPTVKTKAKAQARADRMLADLDEQDVRISTSVILPAAKVTQLKAGMRTEIRGTHWPDGWDDWHYVRVLQAAPEPISVGREYRVALDLGLDTGSASPGPVYPPGAATSGGIMYQPSDFSDAAGTLFQVFWGSNGDSPGLGYGARPRDAAHFAYIGTLGTQEGWRVLASAALLDLAVQISLTDAILSPSRTYTFQLRLNDAVIATDAYTKVGSGAVVHTFTITVADLACVAGDELTTWIAYSELANPAVPSGTGDLSNRFEIVNTSLVAA